MSFIYVSQTSLKRIAMAIREDSKIIILGSPGTGKTTFAKQLIQLVKLSYTSLDDLNWEENWERVSTDLFYERLKYVLNDDSGIIDGNYYDRFLIERIHWADIIIYLDYPTWVAFWGLVKRSIWRYIKGSRTCLPANVVSSAYKRKWELSYPMVKKVLCFRKDIRPRLIGIMRFQKNKIIIVINSRKKAKYLLDAIKVKKD
ncbi:hypothetical protein ACFSCZ_18030 [Siminovitchia sediminis]|uniref:Adenylate kinase n=1 Tax=Siminovitchia sediminis TaxID=1274353 RepID=A0ABW4KKP0_9BACI